MSNRYQQSEILLERALKSIPLGAQTFSKSMTQFPLGAAPFFIERGEGSRVWDVDGNEYIDFLNGLLSLMLGYKDPDVDEAVKKRVWHDSPYSFVCAFFYVVNEQSSHESWQQADIRSRICKDSFEGYPVLCFVRVYLNFYQGPLDNPEQRAFFFLILK